MKIPYRTISWAVGLGAAAVIARARVRRDRATAAVAEPDDAGGYRSSFGWRVLETVAHLLDRTVGWDRLPTPLGLAVLIGVRNTLRKRNLYDTSGQPAVDLPPIEDPHPSHEVRRAPDGSYNDLGDPRMGMAGARFGRNVPIERTSPEPRPEILRPSPREVSRDLLTRRELVPATSVNALVAAWLQFMIRDWFSHGKSPEDNPWEVELLDDDPFPTRPLRIMRTRPDPTAAPDAGTRPPTYANTNSHWWDASQLYGNTLDEQREVRTGVDGKLQLTAGGRPPAPQDPERDPARVPGFWLGVLMMQTLFAREHNAICDRLRAEYPHWSDEELFQRARLVNAALLAKIHTVEWTPAVISHPTTRVALRANWWGLAGERVYRMFGRLSSSEVISGIPGSATQHYGVPYSLTEEFVAVYRMHPLVPDHYAFHSVLDGRLLREATLYDLTGPRALEIADKMDMADLLYSFGTMHPGVVALHNFPRFLQEFERPDGKITDLAATDILRTRELGVPRYNEFRRLLRLAPARTFESLAGDPEVAETMRRLYDGDIEKVDLIVGMYAERRPQGFAFSDTAFRIFILMASRRLNSDRFFTKDYRPAVYTRAGLEWINNNTMATVLRRHFPNLQAPLQGVANAFEPWVKRSQQTDAVGGDVP